MCEVRDRKTELVGETNDKLLEERGSHVGKKCFQVRIDTPEFEDAEFRKCDTSYDWDTQQLHLDLTPRSRREEAYIEFLKPR
jgi:hypothetical protein